jgi:hypothetical protein
VVPSGRTNTERLRLFIERMDQAVNRRAVREQTIYVAWSLTGHPDEGSSFSSDSGDDEDLRSLLLDFRSFMAEREDVFAGVCSTCCSGA